MTTAKKPLIGLTLGQLQEVAASIGLRPFAAKQIARRLYVSRATDISEMTELPKAARAALEENYTVGRTAPRLASRSTDGTVKYLFSTEGYLTRGAGGRDIEAVYIPDRDRATLCVSSQAGCRMGCRFCMTGRQGYHGDLSAAGIINQILSIPDSESLTNIVFMGMGEPMDNVDEVLRAIEILTAPWGLAWSPKRITVSSIGKLDGLRRLLDETKVHIAISVHTPYTAEREALCRWSVRFRSHASSGCFATMISPTSADFRPNISCGAVSTTICGMRHAGPNTQGHGLPRESDTLPRHTRL